MFNFFENICGCFSPQLKKSIIDYLNSANLNNQVIQQQKCNEQTDIPSSSIYSQIKNKSFYFMKVKQQQQSHQHYQLSIPSAQIQNSYYQPYYYPQKVHSNHLIDQLYKIKLATLKRIFSSQIGPQYSKIYDSQDETALKIYCKAQSNQNKRYNSYRFIFKINKGQPKQILKNYLQLKQDQQSINKNQHLLAYKQFITKTQNNIQIYHRRYKKVLVINQHDLYTAEKIQEIEGQIFSTTFSVKGDWEKIAQFSRGWINLSGMKAYISKTHEQNSNSLSQQQQLFFQGYINAELQISVNANMLKQPIAKQIRLYVQNLIKLLTKFDAL